MKMALTRIGKEKIRQLTPITEGGEGYIYEFGNDILKIYKPCVDIAAKEKKVAMLIDKPLPKEAIKPITAVYDNNNKFIGCVTFYILQKRERRRRKEKKKKVSLNTYAKVATTAVLAHGMLLTSCSYILSWIGMDPVVDVSSTIVKEIVAPLVVYLGTNTIMNIFEKNKLSFSVPINSTLHSHKHHPHFTSSSSSPFTDWNRLSLSVIMNSKSYDSVSLCF